MKQTRAKAEAPAYPLVKDAIPERIRELVATGKLRRSSEVNYLSRFRKWVQPAIGAKRVDQVTREDLGAIITTVQKAGAVSAIKHILNPLRSYYRLHRELTNPALDLRDYLDGGSRAPKKVVEVFTRAEQDKILAALGSTDRLFTEVAFDTGCRWNEVAGFFKTDLDAEQRVLHVRRGVNRFGELTEPKTPGSLRPVPVSKVLVTRLQAHIATLPADGALLFPSAVGTPRSYPRFHERWKKALEAAGVRRRGFHTCRHSFTTRMRDTGVKLETVSKWLGHSKPSITLDVYSHVTAEGWADAVRLKDTASAAVVA